VVLQSARGRGLAYFVDGVRSGTAALVGNTVFAFSNATTKMSGAVRKGLLTIGLDQPLAEPGECLLCDVGGLTLELDTLPAIPLMTRTDARRTCSTLQIFLTQQIHGCWRWVIPSVQLSHGIFMAASVPSANATPTSATLLKPTEPQP